MPPSLKQQLDICQAALALSPAVRTTFLKRYCGNDVELLSTLEILIRTIQQADPFLEPVRRIGVERNSNDNIQQSSYPANNTAEVKIGDEEDSD